MDIIIILQILFLGIVEGVTEWLPISSTGHMLLIDAFFPLNARETFKEMFFVVVQLGAILAVAWTFWKKLFPFHVEKMDNPYTEKRGKLQITADMGIFHLWGKIIIACIPSAVFGILLDDFLEAYLHTPLIIALALLVYGVAFLMVEKRKNPQTIASVDALSYKTALMIGLFQTLALIPGTSRSGATILGALLLGVSRPAGAEFSFYLALPVMFGASAVKLLKFFLSGGGFVGWELVYLLLGSIVAFVVSLLVIRFFMNFLKKRDFKPFGWYRIVLGCLVIATLVVPSLL